MTAAAVTATLQPGDFVGRYEIVRHLATGGMAELYIARASGLEGVEQVVALKRVHAQFADDPEFVQMFLDEAKISASLNHHGVAQVLEFGRDDETYYYTMELLRGRDLTAVCKGIARRAIEIDFAAAVAIGLAVASALHYVHEVRELTTNQPLGLVHRDVSPSNIIVTYDGGVKIVDFGIAKSVVQRTQTRANAIKGKIPYMSPEQCWGQKVDRRSDVYALGVVLYELTTGRRAFFGSHERETIEKIIAGKVQPLEELVPGYPPALARCIRTAMAPDREDRYASALELALALEDVAMSSRYLTSSVSLGAWLQRAFGPPEELVLGPASPTPPSAPASRALSAAETTPMPASPSEPASQVAAPASIVGAGRSATALPEVPRARPVAFAIATIASVAVAIAVAWFGARAWRSGAAAVASTEPWPLVSPRALAATPPPVEPSLTTATPAGSAPAGSAPAASADGSTSAGPTSVGSAPAGSTSAGSTSAASAPARERGRPVRPRRERPHPHPQTETWRDSPFLPGAE